MMDEENPMTTIRDIEAIFPGIPTLEGAGVRLNRMFGHAEAPRFDPFLLLDDFSSRNPEDFAAGFPWHPHRGIETVTYVLEGQVRHGDSLGNTGKIGPGEMQWMTAGSGIVHQEMPQGSPAGALTGLQLWVNLPADSKMIAPRYRDIKASDIPMIQREDGATVRVICGRYDGREGPVQDIVVDPEYLDVTLPAGSTLAHAVDPDHTVLAYILSGEGHFGSSGSEALGPGRLVLLSRGDEVRITGAGPELRFLLISGKPLGEPVAWDGPIVMNTQEELEQAFKEYREGTFLK
jgi:redox-sensitive bicupin YhaK (pirin superfamily)